MKKSKSYIFTHLSFIKASNCSYFLHSFVEVLPSSSVSVSDPITPGLVPLSSSPGPGPTSVLPSFHSSMPLLKEPMITENFLPVPASPPVASFPTPSPSPSTTTSLELLTDEFSELFEYSSARILRSSLYKSSKVIVQGLLDVVRGQPVGIVHQTRSDG